MKKILQFKNEIVPKGLILLLVSCFALVACSNGDGTSGNGNQMGEAANFEQDLRGVAQKGMFLAGTTVTAWQLGENGQRTGTTLSTVMEGSQGFYDLALSWSGWTEVQVQGRYFDEFTGADSLEPITLSAILNIKSGENLKNINLFTHLQAARIQSLAAEAVPLETATEEALEETQLLVGLGDVDPGELDLTEGSGENAEKNAALLLFSGAFLAEGGDVTTLERLSNDFADDGETNGEAETDFNNIGSQAGDEDLLAQLVENLQTQGVEDAPNSADLPEEQPVWVNESPIAEAGPNESYPEGSQLTLSAANSSDTDGEIVSYAWTQLEGDQVTLDDATSLNPAFTAPVVLNGESKDLVFQLTVTDNQEATGTDVVRLTILPVNESPAVQPQDLAVAEDTTLDITFLGTDNDGDALSYSVITQPTNGTLSISQADVGSSPVTTYTPNANFNGTDSFTYKANDSVLESATTTVSITVNAVNDAPVANAVTQSLNEDTSINLTLTGSDIDGDSLSFSLVNQPANGSISGTQPNITYTPNPNFVGQDNFSYIANDGTLGSVPVNVNLSIAAVNDAPTANAQTSSVDEDNPLSVTLSGGDIDGDALTFSIVGQPSNGVLSGTAPNVTYTPNADYNGTDSFSFKASDSTLDSAVETVSITVNPVNDSPTATAQSQGLDEDSTLAIELAGSDIDGDTLSFSVSAQPANGTLSGTAPNLTYTPNTDFNGTDSFTFVANDGSVDSIPVSVELTVSAVNDAPIASAQAPSVDEDNTLSVTLSAGDVDGDTLTFSVVNQPSNGVLSGTAPNLTFEPNANFNGTDSFTFKASDSALDSEVATVNITVNPVNDTPTATAQAKSLDEDNTLALELTGNDIDGDALSFSVSAQPANGTLSGTAPNLTYTPNTDFNGTDSFTFVANDGSVDSTPVSVELTVAPVNDAPIASAQAPSVDEDNTLSVTLSAGDVDGDTLTFSVVDQPSNGVLSGIAPNLTFEPNANFNGTDSFTFRASDSALDSEVATVNITVNPVNDMPTAIAQAKSLDEDNTLALELTGNDIDGDVLNFSISTQPTNGTLSGVAPNLTYTPTADFNGTDSFTYIANDGLVDSTPVIVDLAVASVNDAPIANSQTTVVDEDNPLTITLSGDDIDGDTLDYQIVNQPANGVLTGAGESLTYTPNENFNGFDNFDFGINDGDLDSNIASVSITVSPVNDNPVITFNAVSANWEGANFELVANASDVDGDALTYHWEQSDTSGHSVFLYGAGGSTEFFVSPEVTSDTTLSFDLTVQDGNGGMNTETVHVAVNNLTIDDPLLESCNIDNNRGVDLFHLNTLSCYDVDISGADFSELSKIPSLREMRLEGESLSVLPDLSELDGLVNLEISSTQISDLSPISELTSLKSLSIGVSNTQITDLSPIAELDELTFLNIYTSVYGDTPPQVDLTPLAGMGSLEILSLYGTQVSGLDALSEMTTLSHLSISNYAGLDLSVISTLTGLNYLYIDGNFRGQTGPPVDMSILSGLINLTNLILVGNDIDNLAPVSSLIKLNSLHLSQTQISDLTSLSGLNELYSLEVRDNQITDLTPLASLTKLEFLDVQGNPLTSLSPLATVTHNLSVVAGSEYCIEGVEDLPENINISINQYWGSQCFVNAGASPASSALMTPNGGESWNSGETQLITWDTTAITGATVNLYVLHDSAFDLLDPYIDLPATINSKNWYQFAASVPNTGSLSIDPVVMNGTGNQYLVLIVSESDNSIYDISDNTFSLNNIILSPEPTDTPLSPTQSETDVISIYSDAYTSIAGVDTNPGWGQSTITTEEVIAGNNVLKMSGIDYQGIDWDDNRKDVSCFSTLHIDYWSADSLAIDVYAIGNLGESSVYVPLSTGSWQSIDIPLSSFSSVGLSEVRQLKFVGYGTVFIDNIYFYNDAGEGTDCAPPNLNVSLIIVNGFDGGAGNWTSDTGGINIVDDNGNSVNSVMILDGTASPDAPWNRSFQQSLNVTMGKVHTVQFKAKSDRNRSIIVGIGLNEAPWNNNRKSVDLTSEWQDFEVSLLATDFGGAFNRVFFELAGEDGLVLIDDVSVSVNLGSSSGLSQIDLPVTFDESDVDYALTDFGGTGSTLTYDPLDITNMVVSTIKSGGAEIWAGTTIGRAQNQTNNQGFASLIPFTNSATSMSVRVYSPDAGIPVRFKVERSDDPGITAETETLTTVANQWETMVFDLSSVVTGSSAFDPSAGYDKASIFFNFGTDGATAGQKTYLWDEVTFVETLPPSNATDPTDAPFTPVQHGADVISIYSDTYTNIADVDTNPFWQQTTITTEESIAGNNVLKMSDLNYQGIDWDSNRQDVSCFTGLHIDYWSADAGYINVYAIGSLGELAFNAPITTTGSWQSLDIPLSTYSTVGLSEVRQLKFEGAGTVYIDNVYFFNTTGEGTQCIPPVTGIDLVVAGGFDAGAGAWTSDNGGLSIVDDNGNSFNSVTIIDGFETPNAPWNVGFQQLLSITQGSSYTVKFKAKSDRNRSIITGIGLNGDPWTNAQISVGLTSDWQDFEVVLYATEFGGDLNRLFFELAGEAGLVLIDDISVVENSAEPPNPSNSIQVDLPVSFDEIGVDYAVTDFDGTISTLSYDPVDSTNMVMSTIKSAAAQFWAGTTIGNSANTAIYHGFASVIPFTDSDTKISVRVYSQDAGTPVRLKVERSDDPTITAETETLTTIANAWETMVFDLNNVVPGSVAFDPAAGFDKATIFFNFGTDGATAGEKTYLWDDVTFGVPQLPANTPEPINAPAVPTLAEPNVISIYSDAYVNVPLSGFPTVWSVADIEEQFISANNVQKMTGLYMGIETDGSIDGTNINQMHIDTWAAEGSSIKFIIRDYGPNGIHDANDDDLGDANDDSESIYIHTINTNGVWESVDIPLTSATKGSLSQIVIDAANANSTIYFDNIYFH